MFSFLLNVLHAILVKPPSILLHYTIILPLRTTLHYAGLPFQYLYSFVLQSAVLVFQLIASLETLALFVGTAALVGLLAGGALHVSCRVWIALLRISSADEAKLAEVAAVEKRAVRTAGDYRRERGSKKRDAEDGVAMKGVRRGLESQRLRGMGGRFGGDRGLLRAGRHQMILEEQSSEDS